MTSQTHSPPVSTMSAGPTAWREAGAVRLPTWPVLAAAGVDAAVTARSGGVSSGPYDSLNLSFSVGDDPAHVLENRRRLAASFGASPGDFVFAGQVHGTGVRVVRETDRGSGTISLDDVIADTDVLVTSSSDVVLAILTADCVPIVLADCVPIVLHDPVTRVLACVHAGYQVGPDVYQGITQAFGSAAGTFIRPDSVPDRWRLDLWTANHLALGGSGVPAAQIQVTDIPTGPGSAGPGYFFSDRSDRPCGRLALVARLRTGGER